MRAHGQSTSTARRRRGAGGGVCTSCIRTHSYSNDITQALALKMKNAYDVLDPDPSDTY